MIARAATERDIRLIVETILSYVTHWHIISRWISFTLPDHARFKFIDQCWVCAWAYCTQYKCLEGIDVTFQIEELFVDQSYKSLRLSKAPDFFAAKDS